MNRIGARFLAAAVFLLVFPFFLRRRPRVERKITICAPPSAIFPLISDLRNWPLWTSWHRDPAMTLTYSALSEGAGAWQRWETRRMSGVLRIVRCDRDSRIDYEVIMGRGAYQLLGRLELEEDGACTRVTWRCVWASARNPYRRYFDLFCRWLIARDFTSGLSNLREVSERRRIEQALSA